MREGSDLVRFAEEFPGRYFDVAIAEQHSVTLAAGMACEGLKPVVAIYSTFLQRAYDQLIHDVILQKLPVLFAIDRAGLVGGDGPTHNGSYDLSFLRCLPDMVIMAPADENECRQMLYTGYCLDRPAAVRYPRGTGPGVPVQQTMKTITLGKGEVRRTGKNIAILAFGSMLQPSLEAGEILDATVVNMRFIKPMDDALIIKIAGNHELLVTVEENVVQGGAGSAVNEVLAENGMAIRIANFGLPDRLIEHGTQQDMLNDAGLTSTGITAYIRSLMEKPAIVGAARSA
jgi:1-deoxy-D-xylulose-5-phosphate synthase